MLPKSQALALLGTGTRAADPAAPVKRRKLLEHERSRLDRERTVTDKAGFSPVLERALCHALQYLEGTTNRPVGASAELAHLRSRFDRTLPQAGAEPIQIDELVRDSEGGIIGNPSGRFFGWVIGGTLPAALAADWLTSAWDQNAAIYACGPAQAIIEEVTGNWLKDLFGLSRTASFAFVDGAPDVPRGSPPSTA